MSDTPVVIMEGGVIQDRFGTPEVVSIDLDELGELEGSDLIAYCTEALYNLAPDDRKGWVKVILEAIGRAEQQVYDAGYIEGLSRERRTSS